MNKSEGLELSKWLAEKFFPGQWNLHDMMSHQLCVISGKSTMSILGPKISQRPEPFLSLSCAVATGVQLSLPAYELMNSVNSDSWFGSFHYMVAADGTATAIYGLVIPLETVEWTHPTTVQWVATMINSVIGHSETVAPDLMSRVGGVPFAQRHPVDSLILMT